LAPAATKDGKTITVDMTDKTVVTRDQKLWVEQS